MRGCVSWDRGCVNLVSVLEQLLPQSCGNEILDKVVPPALRSASIARCQFVQLAHKFSPRKKIRLAERHCGATFQQGQRGADAVIPILRSMALFWFNSRIYCRVKVAADILLSRAESCFHPLSLRRKMSQRITGTVE